jgi:hypothetical protein
MLQIILFLILQTFFDSELRKRAKKLSFEVKKKNWNFIEPFANPQAVNDDNLMHCV